MQNVVFQNIECKTILVIHFRKAEEGNENSAESETPTDKGNVEGVPSLKNGIACCGPLYRQLLYVYPYSFRYLLYCLEETFYRSASTLYYFYTWLRA